MGPSRKARLQRGGRRAAITLAVFGLAASYLATPVAGHADSAGLDHIGNLPTPKGAQQSNSIAFFGIDTPNRHLYVDYSGNSGDILAEYDLNHTIPTIARTAPYPSSGVSTNPYTVTIDSADHRAFMVVNGGTGVPDVQAFDLKTLSLSGKPWKVQTKLPGFDVMGLAYSARDHRVYAAGFFAGGVGVGSEAYTLGLPALPSGIAAFDTNGNLAWWKVIPQCQFLGGHFSWGAAVFASQRLPALYVFCIRPSNIGVELEDPGETGLVRLWIKPDGTQTDANSYRVEFFPVAGHYVSGAGSSVFAAFDPAAERVYVLNQSSTTPGLWGFDGSLSAWVGFSATDSNNNGGLAVDSTTGHVFMKAGDVASNGDSSQSEQVIVTAGRATPVPQGVKFPVNVVNSDSLWLADSVTHRVFPPLQAGPIAVVVDRTPANLGQQPIDYDSLTANVPEGANTTETFAGDASGYGARALLVGGYGGVVDPAFEVEPLGLSEAIGGFSPGDRSLTVASVPSLDLRDTGAAATAQAVSPDSLTQNDYTTRQQFVQQQGNAASNGTGDQVSAMMNWKWPSSVCLDPGDSKNGQSQSGTGGTSSVECDLNATQDTASATFTGFAIPNVTVGSTSFDASSHRDPKLGIVTDATAVVRHVQIAADGVGSLFIDRVEATATTIAHGRSGTANAGWKPAIEGLVLRDPNGAVLYSCAQCDPQQVADQVNGSALATKIRILLPAALLQKTPHGAYASVGKNDTDYWSGLTLNDDNSHAVPAMQIEIYNDYGQKSRVVLQLAAIQASSIYGISVLPTYQPPPGGGGLLGSILPPISHNSAGPSTIVDGKYLGGSVGGSALRRFTLGVGLLFRSPKDSLLFALVCLLFGGAAVLVRRRQLLASSLEESSR